MKTHQDWKTGTRLDNIMNVLLIVLALGVLGMGALEMGAGVVLATPAATQRA